jgi:hypothetical protein
MHRGVAGPPVAIKRAEVERIRRTCSGLIMPEETVTSIGEACLVYQLSVDNKQSGSRTFVFLLNNSSLSQRLVT